MRSRAQDCVRVLTNLIDENPSNCKFFCEATGGLFRLHALLSQPTRTTSAAQLLTLLVLLALQKLCATSSALLVKSGMLQAALRAALDVDATAAIREAALSLVFLCVDGEPKHHRALLEASASGGQNALAATFASALNSAEMAELRLLERLVWCVQRDSFETQLMLSLSLSPAPSVDLSIDDSHHEAPLGTGRVIINTLLTFGAAVAERPRGIAAVWSAAACLGHIVNGNHDCKVYCANVSLDVKSCGVGGSERLLQSLLKRIAAAGVHQVGPRLSAPDANAIVTLRPQSALLGNSSTACRCCGL